MAILFIYSFQLAITQFPSDFIFFQQFLHVILLITITLQICWYFLQKKIFIKVHL